jgi:hypothetical protein
MTDYLLPTDWIALGCLLTAIAITFGYLVYSELASKIADRRSALLEEHWATTIREEN